jgi:copper chaperone CopZ
MTERTVSLTVVLGQPHRVDDVDSIINAIKMIKGVSDVGIDVSDANTYKAYTMAKKDLLNEVQKVLFKDREVKHETKVV